MANSCNEQNRNRLPRSAAVTLAAGFALCLGLAACSSPFKGEPEPPREQSGWELGHNNADYPTQQDMDNQDDGQPAP
jgi:hypothetical protein